MKPTVPDVVQQLVHFCAKMRWIAGEHLEEQSGNRVDVSGLGSTVALDDLRGEVRWRSAEAEGNKVDGPSFLREPKVYQL